MKDQYVVKMSRKFISILVGVGLLFVLVGMVLMGMLFSGKWVPENNNYIVFILFELFSFGGGGLIVISQIKNLIRPYTMLTIDEDGLKFAIKANYELINIKWPQIESVDTVANTQLVVMGKNPVDNLIVKVKANSGFPSSQITSSGLTYFNYTLILDGLFMNKRPIDVATEINKHIH